MSYAQLTLLGHTGKASLRTSSRQVTPYAAPLLD
jgi:hypothetical protein